MSKKDGHVGGYEEVMEFTPGIAFNIKQFAGKFAKLMEENKKDLILHLPHISVEFEAGCTRKEIIDGYNFAMSKRPSFKPSNAN